MTWNITCDEPFPRTRGPKATKTAIIAPPAPLGGGGGGGAVAQSVERATPGEEVPGSIPAVAARSLLVGSVSV